MTFQKSLMGMALASLFLLPHSQANAQSVLREILKRMDSSNAATRSLRADVQITRKELRSSDVSVGKVVYLTTSGANPNPVVRLDWAGQFGDKLSIIGDNFQLYRPKPKVVAVGKVSENILGYMLSAVMSPTLKLKKGFDIALTGEESLANGVRTWHLKLDPISARFYTSQEVWIDANGSILQARITELSGDTTTVLLSEPEKNIAVKPGMFALRYPASTRTVKAETEVDRMVKRVWRNYQSIQTLKADVTMVKYDSILKVYDQAKGNVVLLPRTPRRKMYIRLDWTKPFDERIVVIDQDFELYRPRLNSVISGNLVKVTKSSPSGGILAFLQMSASRAKEVYSTVNLGDEQLTGGVKAIHLLITPKSEMGFKSADVWIDRDWLPRQVRLNFQSGDTTTVLFSNIQKDVQVDAKIFKLNYPSSVKRVKA